MKTTRRILTLALAIGILGLTAVSCSKSSIADEDALYDNQQGIDKYKIFVPTNG